MTPYFDILEVIFQYYFSAEEEEEDNEEEEDLSVSVSISWDKSTAATASTASSTATDMVAGGNTSNMSARYTPNVKPEFDDDLEEYEQPELS